MTEKKELPGKPPTDLDRELFDDLNIVARVTRLFEEVRNPKNGDRYTPREVETLSNGKVKYHWLRKVLNGEIENPGIKQLYALSSFFGLDPSYWMSSEEAPIKFLTRLSTTAGQGEEAEEAEAGTKEAGYSLALRSFGLDNLPPDTQRYALAAIESVVDALRRVNSGKR